MPLRDTVTISATGVGGSGQTFSFDSFTSLSLVNSVVRPAEASFEVGDVETFREMRELLALGALFTISINGRKRLTGRLEARDAPLDASQSGVVRFVVRTRLSDALFTSADPNLSVGKLTIEGLMVELFKPLGLTRDNLIFTTADLSRNLITGKSKRGGKAPPDLDKIKIDQAKVKPPETIWQFAVRHLQRHGLMLWDSPDGNLVIGLPDDEQAPDYLLRSWLTGPQRYQNNIVSLNRTEDVTQAATQIDVYGVGGGKNYKKSRVHASEILDTLVDAGFARRMIIVDENVQTAEMAARWAKREMAARRRQVESLTVRLDGFSHALGNGERTPYAPDTTADIITEHLGGALGLYYVEEVTMAQGLSTAQACDMRLVPRGVWQL